MVDTLKTKSIGPGAGLRPPHYPDLLARPSTSIEWFEIITENFLTTQGRPRWVLEKIRADYPVAFHGVSLSIGSPEALNWDYLKLLKNLIADFSPFIVSDHFCWTGLQNNNTHNLLPLPLNQKTIDHLVPRILSIQDFLGRAIALENASAYMQCTHDEIPEWVFIEEICRQSGCGILLDINNLFVTSQNFGLNPEKVLQQVPAHFVRQVHLAGHTDMGTYLFDTHSCSVQAPVWDLYQQWLMQGFSVPTMIEWDDQIPEFLVLEAEVAKIGKLQTQMAQVNTQIQEPPLGL
jgi:uncharacterized protein (UPF0276 family)